MQGEHTNTNPWYTAFYRRGHLLALSIIIILVAGMSAITSLPRLEDPRIDLRNVIVLTSYPGASAERVEALITDVLEDELRQLFEITEIKSTSTAGFSLLLIELQNSVDNSNNQQVFSKIRDVIDDAAKKFPAGAGQPFLEDKRGAASFTALFAVKAAGDGQLDLSQVSRMTDELADSLRNVPGTELVRTYGAPREQITVAIDPQQLALSGLSIEEVSKRITLGDPKLPAGVLNTSVHDMRVQVSEPLDSTAILAQLPIQTAQGQYLRLQDIAEIERGELDPAQEIALVNGERAVFLAVRMQTTVRIDKWTESILTKVDEFNQIYGQSVHADLVFEQSHYTEDRLNELAGNLLLGSAVVIFVVLFFMGKRAAVIVGLALPMCASFAIFSLSFFDQQIHQMSIFGIIIAIGLLIDNAIVITDEIRINLQDSGMTRVQVLVKSVRHLFSPLLASTLTTILGFMPIFLLNGNIGDFIGSIAISVVMALIGSLAISLTIIAALAARYLPREVEPTASWLKQGFQLPDVSFAFSRLVGKAVKLPYLVLPGIILVCGVGYYLSSQLEDVFFPSADRDQFEIYLMLPKGSGIDKTHQAVTRADEFIRQQSGIKQVTWMIGNSTPSVYYNQVMTRDNTAHFANAVVTANSVGEAAKLVAKLQFELQDALPDTQITVRKFGQGPPIAAPIEVEIYGTDLQVLDDLGKQVRLAMTEIPGVSQSLVSISVGEPQLTIDVNENQSLLSHLSLSQIAQQLQVALSGRTGGSILEGTEELPVRVRVTQNKRNTVEQVDALPLITNNSGLPSVVGVGAIGQMRIEPSISGITRTNGERLNRVQAFLLPNVPAVSASAHLRDVLEERIQLPPGYRIKMSGDADEQQQALGQLSTYLPVLLVLMITSLILSFSSVRFAGVIALVAMLSVGLGFMSLWISGLPLGFNPLLGCAGLIGVAINGSIVVIAAIAANPTAMKGDTREIVRETMGCSRHILSTTFTTVGGLIPLLLFSDGSFWPPLAVVIAGGVGFSVVLSLLFTPVLVAWLCRLREKRKQMFAKATA